MYLFVSDIFIYFRFVVTFVSFLHFPVHHLFLPLFRSRSIIFFLLKDGTVHAYFLLKKASPP